MSLALSIVLPVYNVSDYIERCIRSLEEQDLERSSYEIVVVNDGSSDNSEEVVRKLMAEYSNIILYSQTNAGVSVARNMGIELSKGEFLLFIDPDDYVKANTLREVLHYARANQAQVTFMGYTFLNANGEVRIQVLYEDEYNVVFSGMDAYYLSRGDGRTDPDRSVGILYNRLFLNQEGIEYVVGVPYLEDGEFLARVLCLANRCVFWSKPFYFRTTRMGSATNSKMILSKKASHGFLKAADSLVAFQKARPLTPKQKIFLNQPIAKFTLLPLTSLVAHYQFLSYLDIIGKEPMKARRLDLDGVYKTYQRYGRIFNRSKFLLFFYVMFDLRMRQTRK